MNMTQILIVIQEKKQGEKIRFIIHQDVTGFIESLKKTDFFTKNDDIYNVEFVSQEVYIKQNQVASIVLNFKEI